MGSPRLHSDARADSVAPLEFLRILWQRKGTLIAFVLAFAGLALLLANAQRPRFQSSATLMLSSVGVTGMMADLAALSALTGDTPALAEVAVLRSHAVVAATVSTPPGPLPPTPDNPEYARHLGLTTTVTDQGLHPTQLFRQALAGESPHDRPPVFAEGRLFAAVSATEPGSPRRIRIEFLAPDRLRITTHGILQRIGIADDQEVVRNFEAGEPLEYRGLELHLATQGVVAGRSFLVDQVPTYEAEEQLLERFWAGETTRGSGIIRVTVSDTDPQRAAETANAICANYLVEVQERRGRRSSPTLAYIQGLLDRSRSELEEAQSRLFQVQSEKPELIALDEAAAGLMERISQLELVRTEAELRRRTLSEILERLAAGEIQALAGLDTAITRGVVVDPITEGYLLSIAELNAEYTQLSQDLGENHPDLVHLRGSGKELYGLVQAQLESRVRSLAAQVHEQEDEVARLRTELGRLPGDLVAISEPMLTAEIQQKLLPALLTSLHTAEIAHESTSTRVELLDQAEPATEVHSPKLLVIVLLGGLLGLALGATLAFVRAPISAAIQRPDELQLAASAEVLAVVPCTAPGRAHPLDPEGDAREAQGLRSLRAALQHAGAGRVERLAVGLTSPVDAPLRTRLALGLAQAMGQAGVRTLVVDLDLDSEALRQELGCEPASGLLALLSTPEPEGWRAAVQESALLGIDYLGAGADGSPDLLAGPAFASLLQELGAAYPFVLLDLPSTGSGSTLEAVAGSVDGILVVARSGHTRKLTVETLAQRIRRAGGRLLGCVLLTRAGARHA